MENARTFLLAIITIWLVYVVCTIFAVEHEYPTAFKYVLPANLSESYLTPTYISSQVCAHFNSVPLNLSWSQAPWLIPDIPLVLPAMAIDDVFPPNPTNVACTNSTSQFTVEIYNVHNIS